MNVFHARQTLTAMLLAGGLLLVGIHCHSTALAGEARLKNGTVLRGNLWLMNSLSGRPTGLGQLLVAVDAAPTPHNIVLIANGWQKYYVPRRQIPDEQLDKDITPARPEAFELKPLKTSQSQVIASVGSVTFIEPFDEHGHRRLTLATEKGPLHVIQGITRIEPDHIEVEGLNCKWKVGLSLRSLPLETLNQILHKQIKADDPIGRLALVRFYTQAEYYPQAFAELDALVRDFPDQQPRAEIFRAELMDHWGREVLRQLGLRRSAGQHQLAEDYAKKLSAQELGGAVMEDVRTFVREYNQSRQTVEKTKNLLIDWQAKLMDTALMQRLQPLRSEINEQLDIETLPRLDAFLKAEGDTKFTAAEHLALAYSGWVVGAANAVTDLELAIRLWDARFAILEYQRAETQQDRDALLQQLRQIEGVGPKVVLQLVPQLPPAFDASVVVPGEIRRVSVTPEGHSPSIAYSVLLPPEYSPHHSYPLLIALRSRNRTNEETLHWWGGDIEQPGPALRRGYIVIAPEYAEDKQSEYTYSIAAHQAVIESLRDARRRFSVDSDRVFLAGHGMGGDAAFDLGMSHPDEFAGVIPIGGDCEHYPRHTYENGRHTAWYVVGRGFDADQRDSSNNVVFDEIYKRGAWFDFLLVEYLGRGNDRFVDEVPKLFDWMDLHRRAAFPKDVKVETLRKSDNRFFWATALDLPRTTVLPLPPGAGNRVNKMGFEARVSAGNTIYLESPANRYVVRFLPGLVDFDKRVVVKSKGRQKFNNFITPDTSSIMEELRTTGDRTRLPLATMEF